MMRQIRLLFQHHIQFARNVVKAIEDRVQEVETDRIVKLHQPLAQSFQEYAAVSYVKTKPILVQVGLTFAFTAPVYDFSEAFALVQTQKVLD